MNIIDARLAAEQEAAEILSGLYTGPRSSILESTCMETADCWIFFQNRSIEMPPERALSRFAYAFSKHTGEGRLIPDYWDDPERLAAFIADLSSHFRLSAG